ncbi:MAG: hypothetical protein WCC04_10445 [Terriglobales bacterium]
MKLRLLALLLALSFVGWAQENPSASTPNASSAGANSCCHHAANATDAKDAADCCGKEKCQTKDGKSCCGGKQMADAKSCCGDKGMKKCMKQCKKNGGCTDGKCCGAAGAKSAMNCCGTKCEHHASAS